MNLQKGFTLVEITIAVAIIGILAAIAVPAYIDYTTRSKVTETMITATAMKSTVTENIIAGSSSSILPSGNCRGTITFASGSSAATKNVASAECSDETGVIRVISTNAAKNVPIYLTPKYNGGNVQWKCWTFPDSNLKYVPSECRSTNDSF